MHLFSKEFVNYNPQKTADMKLKMLLAILLVLLAMYAIFRSLPKKEERPFRANLIQIDTTQVSSILIDLPGEQVEIALKQEAEKWIVSNGQINASAMPEVVEGLLRALQNIKINRVVAQKKTAWPDYQLAKNTATRIRVYDDTDILEDFMIGKTEIDTMQQQSVTYLRLTDAEEVYAVDGWVGTNFNRTFNDFRNKMILQIPPATVFTIFELTNVDTSWQYRRTPQGWMMQDTIMDSNEIGQYLKNLYQISSDTFADDFDEVQGAHLLLYTLSLQENDHKKPYVIDIYRDTLRKMPFILHSNQNPDTYFASDSIGIYGKFFRPFLNFHPQSFPLKQK